MFELFMCDSGIVVLCVEVEVGCFVMCMMMFVIGCVLLLFV